MYARLLPIILAICCAGASSALAQTSQPPASGADLYRRGCAACHGDNGKGGERRQVGFDLRLPDFTDCRFASRERDADWAAIIRFGGRVRAFDRLMPAFDDFLTADQIAAVIAYLRGFCTERRWPSG